MENTIQQGVNKLGNLATEKVLEKFDTDGTNIKLGEITLTSKGQVSQTYQTLLWQRISGTSSLSEITWR